MQTSLDDGHVDVAATLTAIFAPPNRVRGDEVELQPFLRLLETDSVLLLPRSESSNGETRLRWYAAAADRRTERSLRESVAAFVGRSYALVSPASQPDPADPLEAALLGAGFDRLITIEVGAAERSVVRERLTLLAAAWLRAPGPLAVERSPRRVLRDLDDAVIAGRLHDAYELLDELERTGHLSSLNIAFLELRIRARGGEWASILAREDIDDIVQSRPPKLVSAILCEAWYEAVLRETAESGDPQSVVAVFEERFPPSFSGLFRDPSSAVGPPALTLWAAHAAASRPVTSELQDALQRQVEALETPLPLVSALLRIAEQGEAEQSLDIGELLERREYATAWRLAADVTDVGPEGLWQRIEVMARCATETEQQKWVERVVEEYDRALDETSPPSRSLSLLVEALRPRVQEPLPTSWGEWIHGVLDGTGDVASSRAALRHDAWLWDPSTLLAPEAIETFARGVDATSPAAELLRDARPLLLDACIRAGQADEPRARRFLFELAQTVALDSRIGESDVRALLGIADRLFDLGISDSEYIDVIAALGIAARRFLDETTVGWAVDVVELVVRRSCLDHGSRDTLIAEIMSPLAARADRLAKSHVEALNDACVAVGLGDLALETSPTQRKADAESRAPWEALAGRRVFIYTLEETAGQRARDRIREAVSSVRIDVWSEHDADARMVQSAQAADVAVIVTRAAKHAATLAIERAIDGRLEPTYPVGTGWSSIVSAVASTAYAFASAH